MEDFALDGLEAPPDIDTDLMLTDAYEVAMVQSYLALGMTEVASFEFFVRTLPDGRNYLPALGIEQAVDYILCAGITAADLKWLSMNRTNAATLRFLERFRFSGDVDAVPEGTLVFAGQPFFRVTAPLPEAQLLESRLINLLQFQTLIAGKAARIRYAAGDARLIDFGFRRAHGAEAGLLAARASYAAGFDGTALLAAGRDFDVPVYGTMAHSFVQACASEAEALEAFALTHPKEPILLIDTYDVAGGARTLVDIAPRLDQEGVRPFAVRLDSGDLAADARRVRAILTAGGLGFVKIVASGGLDEYSIGCLRQQQAPIDGFGVGSALTTSSDAPVLDCAYKLCEYAGIPRRKCSEGKATLPGRKQIFRNRTESGAIRADILALDGEVGIPGVALLEPFIRDGIRVRRPNSLAEVRERCLGEIGLLPAELSGLAPGSPPTLKWSPGLVALVRKMDAEDR